MKKFYLVWSILLFCIYSHSQVDVSSVNKNNDLFWEHVNFGGGIGLNFGSGYFMFTVSPSAIYNFNEKFSVGLGLSYMNLKEKRYNNYNYNAYGGGLIFFYHPIREIQLSIEPEGTYVVYNFLPTSMGRETERFFQEALFLGAGFRTGNITLGARYNVLHNESRNIYGSALLPFVRVYF